MATSLPRLSDAETQSKLAELDGWQRGDNAIVKEFVLGGFTEATRFMADIAPIANAMDHHPDLQLYRYKRVKVILTTHSAGGLTQNDFELAAKIDALAAGRVK
jgi:4a-hydroxytetrahydrobiopterin dehydratase